MNKDEAIKVLRMDSTMRTDSIEAIEALLDHIRFIEGANMQLRDQVDILLRRDAAGLGKKI